MKRIGVNSIVGLIFIAASLYWLELIKELPEGTSLSQYGPGFFPQIIVICISIISTMIIIQDLLNKNKKDKFDFEKVSVLRVFWLILLSIIYIGIMPVAGYIYSTIIVLAIAMLLFGLRKKITLLLVMVSFPIAISVVFRLLLKVQLP